MRGPGQLITFNNKAIQPAGRDTSVPSEQGAIPHAFNGSALLLWCALFGLAAMMFLQGIGHEALWLDETYSFAMIQHGFGEIIRLTTTDVHPPLYYLLLKTWTVVFGTSPVALRLPSVVAALGLVAHGAFAVRRIWGSRTSFIYALLVATSPGIVCFAQEARMYTLLAYLVTGAVLYGYLAILKGGGRDLVWFGVFSWAAGMTHYFGLVAAAMNGLVLLVMVRQEPKRRRSLLVASLGVAALYSPWLVPFVRQVATVARGFWIPSTTLNLVMFGLVAPFAYKFEDVPYPWQASVALALVAAVTVGSLAIKAWRRSLFSERAFVLMVLVYLLTFGFGVAFSRVVAPVFMPRYMLAGGGLLLLIAATGIGALPRLGHSIAIAACLVGLGMPASMRVQREIFSGPFGRLSELVAASGDSAPLMLHNDAQALFPSWHAVKNGRHVLITEKGGSSAPPGGGIYPMERLAATGDIDALLSRERRVWLVDMSPSGYHLDPARIAGVPGWRQMAPAVQLDLPMSWVKVRLLHFERTHP